MQQPWMKVAAIMLVALMASVLTVGCGPEQPEYDRTYRPASPQQPQQWSPRDDGSSQQQAPAQSQDRDNGSSQQAPWPTN